MIIMLIVLPIVVGLVIFGLIRAYPNSSWARRRELARLFEIESARKAWERSITKDVAHIDWVEVRRKNSERFIHEG